MVIYFKHSSDTHTDLKQMTYKLFRDTRVIVLLRLLSESDRVCYIYCIYPIVVSCQSEPWEPSRRPPWLSLTDFSLPNLRCLLEVLIAQR